MIFTKQIGFNCDAPTKRRQKELLYGLVDKAWALLQIAQVEPPKWQFSPTNAELENHHQELSEAQNAQKELEEVARDIFMALTGETIETTSFLV